MPEGQWRCVESRSGRRSRPRGFESYSLRQCSKFAPIAQSVEQLVYTQYLRRTSARLQVRVLLGAPFSLFAGPASGLLTQDVREPGHSTCVESRRAVVQIQPP